MARRLFADQGLAGLLLVVLCVIRVYGMMDEANAYPQSTPLRIDLWIVPLAVALYLGVRHWAVGLAMGLVFFFLRSFGMLYVGSYALALIAEFCARRLATPEPPPMYRDVLTFLRSVLPSLTFLALGIAAARVAFGAIVSDAVLTYHRLGPGMMRIAPGSFYWWIAPGIATTAALAFQSRLFIPERRAQATLFVVPLAVGNSIYFFGRSHENNLIAVSAPLLLTIFLGIDLAALTVGPGRYRRVIVAAPWCVLAMAALFYSGRLLERVGDQLTPTAKADHPKESPQPIVCREIDAVAPDHRVFVFSNYDYWFYERCGYVPEGYVQPLYLHIIRGDVIAQINRLLDSGYKVVVPRLKTDGFDWAQFKPDLREMSRIETADYLVYARSR